MQSDIHIRQRGSAFILALTALLLAGCAQMPPPVATTLTAGDSHSCRLRLGGVPYCWGWAELGLTGDRTTPRATMGAPVPLPTEAQFSALATGGSFNDSASGHTCAIDAAGVLRCWGDNRLGQLAQDPANLSSSLSPVTVMPGTAFRAVSTGAWHSCAITSAGGLLCWGNDSMWQAGQGTQSPGSPSVFFTPRPPTTPIGVTLPSMFTSVSAGAEHSCAIADTGDLWCWGSNVGGQLGVARSANLASQRARHVGEGQLGFVQRFTQVSAGVRHTCGVDTLGEAFCWGDSALGGVDSGNSPVFFVKRVRTSAGADTKFKMVAAGESHSCAIDAADRPHCWGTNFSGELGIGLVDGLPKTFATPVANLSTAKAIAVGTYHSCALSSFNVAVCWGDRSLDQLGDNNGFAVSTGSGRVPSPQLVAGLVSFSAIASGPSHACGLGIDGSVHCWGEVRSGQLGVGGSAEESPSGTKVRSAPVPALRGAALAQISAAGYHACAREGLGQLITRPGAIAPELVQWANPDNPRCWGSSSVGQLGAKVAPSPTCPGPFGCWETGAPAPALSSLRLSSLSAGDFHSCGVGGASGSGGGPALCWGADGAGQLGVATGALGTCLPGSGGPTEPCSDGPVEPLTATGPLRAVVQLASGNRHSCAVDISGDVWCWGSNARLQLGRTGNGGPTPSRVPLGGRKALGVAVGHDHSCALVAPGGAASQNDVWCWGGNTHGQLGDGGASDQAQPVLVNPGIAGGQFVGIAAGWTASCGVVHTGPIPVLNVRYGGRVVCWGGGVFPAVLGRAGQGPATTQAAPIALNDEFWQVVVGTSHACAERLRDSTVFCWGNNALGQLGRGAAAGFVDSPVPGPVAGH